LRYFLKYVALFIHPLMQRSDLVRSV
jgi:hypothetical protein